MTAPQALSIVSNSRLLREGLAGLLAAEIDVWVVGSYGIELPHTALPNPPGHVVLLDGSLSRDSATAWTMYWRSFAPPAHVVVVELANDGKTILACIQAGAEGYTLQGASLREVAETIVRVRQGIAHCSPEITAQLFARLAASHTPAGADPPLPIPLTPRELEVLRYIAADCSNQEIATLLVIEVRTVKHHVHNILEKLHLRHRWDAARVAVERGWIEASTSSSFIRD